MESDAGFDVRSDFKTCPVKGQRIQLTLAGAVDLADWNRAKQALLDRVAHLWGMSKLLPSFTAKQALVKVVLAETCLPTSELVSLLDLIHWEVKDRRPDVAFEVTIEKGEVPRSMFVLAAKPYFVITPPSAN